jgi:hypothetical protein
MRLLQNGVRWWTLVKAVMEFQLPKWWENFSLLQQLPQLPEWSIIPLRIRKVTGSILSQNAVYRG